MKTTAPRLQVVENEYNIILELLQSISYSDKLISKCLMTLKNELKQAKFYSVDAIPSSVVRLNSIVDIETPFGEMKMQLVLPDNSNSVQKRISILTPMGSALYGYSVGDTITWHFPNGEKQIKIINVNHSEFE